MGVLALAQLGIRARAHHLPLTIILLNIRSQARWVAPTRHHERGEFKKHTTNLNSECLAIFPPGNVVGR